MLFRQESDGFLKSVVWIRGRVDYGTCLESKRSAKVGPEVRILPYPPISVMTREDEMKATAEELKTIFTEDGKGRVAKVESLLRLMDNYGSSLVIEMIRQLSKKKCSSSG